MSGSSHSGLVSRERDGLPCMAASRSVALNQPLAGLRHAGGDHGPVESVSDCSDSVFGDWKPECCDGISKAGEWRRLGSYSSIEASEA